MEDKNLKKCFKLEGLAVTIMLIGALMIAVASIIASLQFNILIGIAVSGIFLLIVGLVISEIANNRRIK